MANDARIRRIRRFETDIVCLLFRGGGGTFSGNILFYLHIRGVLHCSNPNSEPWVAEKPIHVMGIVSYDVNIF